MTGSAAVRAVRRLRVRWRRAVTSSLVVQRIQRVGQGTTNALEGSALARAGTTVGRWIRESWLYRWLTAEPDPEVIVIDLRETYTVGPIVAGLDRIGRVVARWWAGATARGLLGGTANSLRAGPIRVASLGFIAALTAEFLFTLLSGTLSWPGLAVRSGLFLLGALGSRVTTRWESLRDARTIRGLRAILEPPEPPAEGDRSDGSTDSDSDQQRGATDDS